ncbi:precorrin-3B C(17)-methyltransferase [Agathobaculum sp.]|uniref:precorrin-3B C(17)-methyltransferase n=1 Tax=Agathobaculum sp. TaxID=2048138 RepID=UPI002A81821E|nr:precorrin-3B C(17)-methyltransferase [Agathobaculum sp.]MDY3619039.1 precorrin-3B C(17)-methyltransferase [Agathobaculum sp.]
MKLYVVGIGPGGPEQMTGRALRAIETCDCVAGYPLYLSLIEPLLEGKARIETAMKQEVLRCEAARDAALSGKTVAMVSSGDAGVYGMAGLMHEVCGAYPEIEIEVVPGVTAATAGAAVLGAPLTHDFAVISLSDLLTPWEVIEKRLRCAAEADFVLCLYNPASKKRADYLRRACGIVRAFRADETPCGLVRNIGRAGETGEILTLVDLQDTPADMTTTVFIGSSRTRVVNGRLVTPRGYAV